MANDLNALEGEISQLLVDTANLDASTKTKFGSYFIKIYPGDYDVFLSQNSLSDTAANRGKFVAKWTFDQWKHSFEAGALLQRDEDATAPDVLE